MCIFTAVHNWVATEVVKLSKLYDGAYTDNKPRSSFLRRTQRSSRVKVWLGGSFPAEETCMEINRAMAQLCSKRTCFTVAW